MRTKRKESIFKIRPIEKNMPEGVKKQIMRANSQVRKYNEMGLKDFHDVKRARDEGRLPKIQNKKRTKFKATGGRVRAAGGGLMEATSRLRAQGLKKGGIARGCGAVMSGRRKKTKMY